MRKVGGRPSSEPDKERALSKIEVHASAASDTAGRPDPREGAAVDFRIPGVFHVRASGAGSRERAAVARVIGTATEVLAAAEPDVSIRFVAALSRPSSLRVVDGGRSGFVREGSAVYVLDEAGDAPWALVTQGRSWGAASIVCRRGASVVPALSGAVDLGALARGWIPLHGSAWTRPDGVCLVLSGWARSGKTGALLYGCARGGTPIGDDRVFLAQDGSWIAGTGRPVVVKPWHRAQVDLPALADRFGAPGPAPSGARFAPAAARLLAGMRTGRRPGTWRRLADKLAARMERLGEVEVDPVRLGAPRGGRPGTRPHALVVLESHDRASVEVEPLDPVRAASMIAAQVMADLSPALRLQIGFDYAQPDGGWRAVDRAGDRVRKLLTEATGTLPCWLIRHSYPCSLEELDAALDRVAASLETHPGQKG